MFGGSWSQLGDWTLDFGGLPIQCVGRKGAMKFGAED
jgi:hypothetical protein